MSTTKEMLNDIRKEALNDIEPNRAAVLLSRLSALLANVNEAYIEAEMNYNQFYEEMTEQYEKVTEARAKAKASEFYRQKLKAESMTDVTQELIRAMKYIIKVKMNELREAQY